MEQKTLKVSGMSCGHCVNSIEGNVSKLDGVEAVKVHLSEGKVDVSYDSASIELEKIVAEIEEQGYEIVS